VGRHHRPRRLRGHGIEALATASHSIAASYGYEDGENIPVELMIEATGTIVSATELPVTADIEAGYGTPGETTRKVISVGAVGANLEDQMKSLADSVAAVEEVLAAGHAEGIDVVLNARTNALVLAGDRPLN
jgi:2-methylisocitrate lyase-like PEP mutase family enzyme